MIKLIVNCIATLATLLQRAAEVEQARCEAKLLQASKLVTAAGVNRKAAKFAREASASLGDLLK